MGFLKQLLKSKLSTLGFASDAFFAEKKSLTREQRSDVRAEMASEMPSIERSLLMKPGQSTETFYLSDPQKQPFDELEFIVKNKLDVKQYLSVAKECILDLDEISNAEDSEEAAEMHRDGLSQGVLNLLHRQAAQVLLLSGADDNGSADLFLKNPVLFVRSTLLEADRNPNAFDEVVFEKDLSSYDLDYNAYLHKDSGAIDRHAIRRADEAFNKDVLRRKKNIERWAKKAQSAKGDYKEECDYRKMCAEKDLALSVEARKSALQEAFRSGIIGEYYFNQRSEQLSAEDFSRVPEMFEADAIKNRSEYLKEHDLQDLSKEEADEICKLAKAKAERKRTVFSAKGFLTQKGLASNKRFMISEMGIDKSKFYRFLSGNGSVGSSDKKNERISVDLEEKEKEEITYVFNGVHTVPMKTK